MRTKPGVDSLSFDDMYNNLIVFENDVKGPTASSSSTQNVAFVSENTNSTNDVSTAYSVSNTSGQNSQYEQTSSYSLLANQSSFPQLDHEDLKQLDEFNLEEMDLKWQVAMISMRMKKFYKRWGSSSKHSAKDSTTYVSKQQQQQEWDAWVEETVIDEDEVISEDETPELISELQDVDKRVPTIYDYARMKATMNVALSNQFKNAKEYAYHLEQTTNFMKNQIVWESRQEDIRRPVPRPLVFFRPQRNPNEPPRYLYNKDLFFLKYGNTEEKKHILLLHKIHAE
ncbi:hypothetical protein Tco_0467553 [Tanacetum coccineum]